MSDRATDDLEVRIVDLPPMRVAVARGSGAQPELEGWETLLPWAEGHSLDPLAGDHRFFGFNDPPPSPERDAYGYQQWMTVPGDVTAEPAEPVTIERFPGGRYAVARCEGVANITSRWLELFAWLERSEYEHGPEPGLEELLDASAITAAEIDPDGFVFDLYLPIASR